MERDYVSTIKKLTDAGLIGETDKYAFCRYDQPATAGTMLNAAFGVLTLKWSTVDYLIAASETDLSVFNISKKTGEYTGEHIKLSRGQIDKLICKKYLFGNRRIILRAKGIGIKLNFFTCNTFKNFKQQENKDALIDALKSWFSK